MQKKANTVVALREDPKLSAEELEAERAAQQEAIDNAEPLTEDEEEEKEQLTAEGFANWTKREFQAFIRGSEVHGRLVAFLSFYAYAAIAYS